MPNPAWKNQNLSSSLTNACHGLNFAFTTQSNFKIHLAISALALALCFWLQVPLGQFLLIVVCIILGLTMELANTAFETVVDLITLDYHPLAKQAKDIAAGMMLLTACGVALVGLVILVPPLCQKLGL